MSDPRFIMAKRYKRATGVTCFTYTAVRGLISYSLR